MIDGESKRRYQVMVMEFKEKVKELEETLRKNRSETFEIFKKEHQNHCDGFSLSCERFGDFLTLSIKRNNNKNRTIHVETISLQKVDSIKLIEGEPPSTAGNLRVRGSEGWREGKHYIIPFYDYPKEPIDGKFFEIDNNEVSERFIISPREESGVITGIATRGKDDVITFTGLGDLFVPFGLGASTLRVILIELERGFEHVLERRR